jgi:hypothetical protein
MLILTHQRCLRHIGDVCGMLLNHASWHCFVNWFLTLSLQLPIMTVLIGSVHWAEKHEADALAHIELIPKAQMLS